MEIIVRTPKRPPRARVCLKWIHKLRQEFPQSVAPVSFAAFMLPGLRSAFIFSNTNYAHLSSSFMRDHPSSGWGCSVGSTNREWMHMASIMTHLLRKPSTLFPVFEIELALPAAMKLAHPEVRPSLIQTKKKWRSRATDGITPTYASQ